MRDATPSEDLLAELGRLSTSTHTAAVAGGTGLPFLVWGLAWLGGYCALGWLPETPGLLGFGACVVLASLASWWPRRQGVRSGWEGRVRRGWLVFLVASPALVATVAPLSLPQVMLFLGGLWSLAMAVYGVAVRDHVLPWLMLTAVFVAGVSAQQHLLAGPAFFGLVAGGATAVFGGVRLARARAARGSA